MLSRSAARPRPATTPNRSRQPHASQLLAPQRDSRGTRLTHIADLLASSAVPCLVRARSGATKGMARRSVRARSANTLGPRGHRTRVAPARVPGRPFTRPPTAFMLRRCKPFPRTPIGSAAMAATDRAPPQITRVGPDVARLGAGEDETSVSNVYAEPSAPVQQMSLHCLRASWTDQQDQDRGSREWEWPRTEASLRTPMVDCLKRVSDVL